MILRSYEYSTSQYVKLQTQLVITHTNYRSLSLDAREV
jgi:hypothetical protein